MKNIFIFILVLMVVTVSLFGQDTPLTLMGSDLGLPPSFAADHSPQRALPYANQKPDTLAARNMLWKPFNAPTIGVQALGGVLLAGVGVAIGYLTTPQSGDASGVGGGLAFALGATITCIGLPTGIYIGGNMTGGNGGLWATLGGCIAGTAIGFLPNALNTKKDATISGIIFSICAIGGGIAGYNLSASPVYEVKEITSTSFGLRPDFQITFLSIHL